LYRRKEGNESAQILTSYWIIPAVFWYQQCIDQSQLINDIVKVLVSVETLSAGIGQSQLTNDKSSKVSELADILSAGIIPQVPKSSVEYRLQSIIQVRV